MKKIILQCAAVLIIVSTSCQRKQLAYFQKSNYDQVTTSINSHSNKLENVTAEIEIKKKPLLPMSGNINDDFFENNSKSNNYSSEQYTDNNLIKGSSRKILKKGEANTYKSKDRLIKFNKNTKTSKKVTNKLALVSLGLGIASIVVSITSVLNFFLILGIALGVLGLITGIIASKRSFKKVGLDLLDSEQKTIIKSKRAGKLGFSLVGIITSILAIIISSIWFIFFNT